MAWQVGLILLIHWIVAWAYAAVIACALRRDAAQVVPASVPASAALGS